MGNCSHKGVVSARCSNSFRVMMDTGRVIALECPKLVGEIVHDYPGYGVFTKGNVLFHHEQLLSGKFYYLLPVLEAEEKIHCPNNEVRDREEDEPVGAALDIVTKKVTNGSGFKVLPPPRKGVWRVKLVIDTKQLEAILSEEVNTEALIEQMRIAATSLTKVAPPRVKSSWGLNWKPIFRNVFKVGIHHHQIENMSSDHV